MFRLYIKVGKNKRELHGTYKTLKKANDIIKYYYESYGNNNILLKNGVKIISNNDPVVVLTIK